MITITTLATKPPSWNRERTWPRQRAGAIPTITICERKGAWPWEMAWPRESYPVSIIFSTSTSSCKTAGQTTGNKEGCSASTIFPTTGRERNGQTEGAREGPWQRKLIWNVSSNVYSILTQ